eukprot:gb/GECH01011292.1/.p1 GENE.gb/GECH01011292.1/~~gb/GECH01011292.1/.p1  ORF type:complete len:190 (+),score=34.93 gb/GECH01011292.1/:1-570(+)
MGRYEDVLNKEGNFKVYKDPHKHLSKANSYSKREILLLTLIGVERVRRSSGDKSSRGGEHPGAAAGRNSSLELEKVFWKENPDAGVVFQDPAKHLNESNRLSNRELMAMGMIGLERIASRVCGPRNAPATHWSPAGKYEGIWFKENPHGGYCYSKPFDGLQHADKADQREVLAFLMIGMERLHQVCVGH